jgi:tRNA (guanosine-2'-O-)-methyltransferase
MTPERRQKLLAVISKRQNDLAVVLENVFDPHNVSAIMRTCDAVGVQELYVVNTRIPLHKKYGFKSSRSANKWVTVHQYSDAAECFAEVKKYYATILTTRLSHDAVGLYDMNFIGSIALVFGNEVYGVSDEVQQYADGSFVIPQVGMIESLNISVACAVTLYEVFRQRSLAGHYEQASLAGDKLDRVYNDWGLKE